jgi:hypothetical protein
MKLKHLFLLVAVVLTAARALALNIPSDGSDGDFNPTGDIVVDLSLAPTGSWNDNNAANAGKGVYDPNKWAVVFKYNSVTIPSGVKVTFINHKTHAPVVWLVKENVQIDGTVSVTGSAVSSSVVSRLTPPEPGPGGFRGGAEGVIGRGLGYGIGGSAGQWGVFGAYASVYGNPQLIPLIGGSGSHGGEDLFGARGGSGGGAILIAAAGSVSVSGRVEADGGGVGSGGAVRVIGQIVSGLGQITALGGGVGGDGRIRIETPALASTLRTAPETIAVTPPTNPIIWPADDAPTVRIVTVDGQAAPDDPTASVVSTSDVAVQNNGTVQVVLETKNFPIQGVVQLRTVQKYGPAAWVNATNTGVGDFARATWIANVTFAPGFTTLQARATVP